jgi:putative endopeptidase
MDKSVKPGDDFYAYANGTWHKGFVIPPDRANYGLFGVLDERSNERVRGILEKAQRDPTSMLGRAYASYLDAATVEARGLAPIQPWLGKIRALKDRRGYSALVVEATQMGIGGPYVSYTWQDDKQPSRSILVMEQGGTGMPDRDMYLSDESSFVKLRKAYVGHLARMLKLAGEENAEARANAVMSLETQIAKAQWTREDATDMGKTYHKFPLAETAQFSSPTLDLTAVLKGMSPKITEVQVREPSAFKDIAGILHKAPLQVLQDQLILRSLDDLSTALPDAIDQEHFAFYGNALKGTPEREPRWKRGVLFMNEALRDEIGKQYAALYFPPEYKAQMNRLVANILGAMGRRIDKLAWMQPQTKVRAKAKLKGFTVKVGYPDKWRDYRGLEIRADDLFGNVVRANRFNYLYMIDKAGEPVRRWEWLMAPQTVNAYANYSLLEITFPAAFLQPPFFDPEADAAVNYGAIGAVIGHEISHHFDDQGAQFNEEGKLARWWTPEDLKAFEAAGKALIAQYDAYEPLPDEHIKGEFTLGENIGDLAGLTVAYDAYQASLGGKPAPVVDGYTADQRFYLGWAQAWRRKYREADLRQRLLTDGHSPSVQRTWVVRNLDPWYRAFGVKPGEKLYLDPSARVHIW